MDRTQILHHVGQDKNPVPYQLELAKLESSGYHLSEMMSSSGAPSKLDRVEGHPGAHVSLREPTQVSNW